MCFVFKHGHANLLPDILFFLFALSSIFLLSVFFGGLEGGEIKQVFTTDILDLVPKV